MADAKPTMTGALPPPKVPAYRFQPMNDHELVQDPFYAIRCLTSGALDDGQSYWEDDRVDLDDEELAVEASERLAAFGSGQGRFQVVVDSENQRRMLSWCVATGGLGGMDENPESQDGEFFAMRQYLFEMQARGFDHKYPQVREWLLDQLKANRSKYNSLDANGNVDNGEGSSKSTAQADKVSKPAAQTGEGSKSATPTTHGASTDDHIHDDKGKGKAPGQTHTLPNQLISPPSSAAPAAPATWKLLPEKKGTSMVAPTTPKKKPQVNADGSPMIRSSTKRSKIKKSDLLKPTSSFNTLTARFKAMKTAAKRIRYKTKDNTKIRTPKKAKSQATQEQQVDVDMNADQGNDDLEMDAPGNNDMEMEAPNNDDDDGFEMEQPNAGQPEQLPGLAVDPGLDQAFISRAAHLAQDERYNTMYGRYVVRRPQDITRQDVVGLTQGTNHLVTMAAELAGLDEESFLRHIFKDNWNTSAANFTKPVPRERVKADASVACGVVIKDAYNVTQKTAALKAGRPVEQMGFARPGKNRRRGATVYVKLRPATYNTKASFVCEDQQFFSEEDIELEGGHTFSHFYHAALVNYDAKDGAICNGYNLEMLTWLARNRLHTWYEDQEPREWNEEVQHYRIRGESPFQPMMPLRTCAQMFGSGMGTGSRILGGMGHDPHHNTPRGVWKSGAVRAQMDHRPYDVNNRENAAINQVAARASGGDLMDALMAGIEEHRANQNADGEEDEGVEDADVEVEDDVDGEFDPNAAGDSSSSEDEEEAEGGGMDEEL
ncbi:hypothetical protein WAI453_007512 [Rhynchosporium graminicola]